MKTIEVRSPSNPGLSLIIPLHTIAMVYDCVNWPMLNGIPHRTLINHFGIPIATTPDAFDLSPLVMGYIFFDPQQEPGQPPRTGDFLEPYSVWVNPAHLSVLAEIPANLRTIYGRVYQNFMVSIGVYVTDIYLDHNPLLSLPEEVSDSSQLGLNTILVEREFLSARAYFRLLRWWNIAAGKTHKFCLQDLLDNGFSLSELQTIRGAGKQTEKEIQTLFRRAGHILL